MDINYVEFLAAAVQAGTPLLFATLGESITEKSGNLNLGVEGMMLMGAVVGFQVGLFTQNPLLALAGAMIAGAAGALIFAFLTVTLRANQVVSGLSLTIFGTGFSGFLGQKMVEHRTFDQMKTPEGVSRFFKPLEIPILDDIPVLGRIIFHQDVFVLLGFLSAIAIGLYLYNTRKGLNLRVVGENPSVADAAGINVSLYKYVHILLGGALCGLGGAYLSLVYVPSWQENITAGRGWIAVALVIFTTWNPYRAILGSFVFGGLDILGFYWKVLDQKILSMLPYAVTIIVLIFISMTKSKENSPPQGLGVPYFREDR